MNTRHNNLIVNSIEIVAALALWLPWAKRKAAPPTLSIWNTAIWRYFNCLLSSTAAAQSMYFSAGEVVAFDMDWLKPVMWSVGISPNLCGFKEIPPFLSKKELWWDGQIYKLLLDCNRQGTWLNAIQWGSWTQWPTAQFECIESWIPLESPEG